MHKQRPNIHPQQRSKKLPVSSVLLTVLTVFLVFIVLLVTWVNFFVYAPPSTQEAGSNLPAAECENDKSTTSTKSLPSTPSVQIPPPVDEVMTDSTNATVMGMATGYNVGVYMRFVGSLRKTGYKGK